MTIVRLLISDGSWLVFLTAENATLALPERTEIPSAVPVGSEVGFESHTTRHFPSSTMGSVSFCALARQPNASAHSTNASITVTSACSPLLSASPTSARSQSHSRLQPFFPRTEKLRALQVWMSKSSWFYLRIYLFLFDYFFFAFFSETCLWFSEFSAF